ncbi:hypothetical protein ARMSODRAFT_980856 [Armillaria solidipes]|uniref:Uncharacterized protein n=1 Tax=Armillaria solidipes TaxID=1076256 RepID=A0A2H3AU11_9AGAR|nr:hypothetical protein ARMSODRAFT_980856 [Armillaria solidipes]
MHQITNTTSPDGLHSPTFAHPIRIVGREDHDPHYNEDDIRIVGESISIVCRDTIPFVYDVPDHKFLYFTPAVPISHSFSVYVGCVKDGVLSSAGTRSLASSFVRTDHVPFHEILTLMRGETLTGSGRGNKGQWCEETRGEYEIAKEMNITSDVQVKGFQYIRDSANRDRFLLHRPERL